MRKIDVRNACTWQVVESSALWEHISRKVQFPNRFTCTPQAVARTWKVTTETNVLGAVTSCHLPSTYVLPPMTRHWIFKPFARHAIRTWDSLVKCSSWSTFWCHFFVPKNTQRLTADSPCSPKGSLNWVSFAKNSPRPRPQSYSFQIGRWQVKGISGWGPYAKQYQVLITFFKNLPQLSFCTKFLPSRWS